MNTSISHNTKSWNHYLRWRLYHNELGFELDFADAYLNENIFVEFAPACNRALQAMEHLEQGAIANTDEHRQVGHYWLRNTHIAPTAAIKDAIETSWQQILYFTQAIHSGQIANAQKQPFRTLLLVGVGGSALGAQLLAESLSPTHHRMSIAFIDNTDPMGIHDTLIRIGDLSRTLVIVVSKSGSTVETRNGMLELKAAYKQQGLYFSKQAVAVTETTSCLAEVAKHEGWLAVFPLWSWVGGRTSIFSTAGLLPAALLGINWRSLLDGAKAMDMWTRECNPQRNPAVLLALFWYAQGNGQGQRDMVILPYRDRLLLFSRYLQQLVMESLGKRVNRSNKVVHQGLTVYGNKGSTDQHAYLQQLRDGLHNFFVVFIRVLRDGVDSTVEVEPQITSGDCLDGFYQGSRKALREGGRQSVSLVIETLSERSLAALVALFDRAVAIYAELIDVNAYHQPGVEAGKVAARDLLAAQRQLIELLKQTPNHYFSCTQLAHKTQQNIVDLWQTLRRLTVNHPMVAAKNLDNPEQALFAWKPFHNTKP